MGQGSGVKKAIEHFKSNVQMLLRGLGKQQKQLCSLWMLLAQVTLKFGWLTVLSFRVKGPMLLVQGFY